MWYNSAMPYRFELAPYACDPTQSKGRLVKEPEDKERNVFQRDRDRIVHSTAFRRLEYKTQVFINHEGDHFRTRLTHSLEVAQIARSIARSLRLNEDLAETLALAHDLGHPPFGHAGEDALDEEMKKFGGFDHNDQALRIVTKLENKYAEFDGLNLTWETLEGIVKHNGPLKGKYAKRKKEIPTTIAAYEKKNSLGLETFASLEAQVAALSDDIAYNNHDIDDGFRAGLFGISDLSELPLIGPILKKVKKLYPSIEEQRLIHETTRRTISATVHDLIEESRNHISAVNVKSSQDVRKQSKALIAFSDSMFNDLEGIRNFLHERMYRHHRMSMMRGKAKQVLRDLFRAYLSNPEFLTPEWRQGFDTAKNKADAAKVICDYVAGMTDRYAIEQHQKLFNIYETT